MTEPKQPTSFARVIVTPVILIVAGLLIGSVTGQTLIAVAVAAVVAIVYILWASRR